MTTTRSRNQAVGVLIGHQPDDLRHSSSSRQHCTCGEELPGGAEALAVHQAHRLDVLELLAADPTEPLSLHALYDLSPGEVVFDRDGRPWMSVGLILGLTVWVTYQPVVGGADELATDDLHAERSPLSLHRPPERACVKCGCTDARACEGGCAWASTDPPVCTACVAVGARS